MNELALVTGASSGIGLELARQFAEHGYDVVVVAEDDRIEAVPDELAATGSTVRPVQADLADDSGVDTVLTAVRNLGRPLDAVALNAGSGNSGAFVDVPWPDERRLLGVNIISAVQLAKAVLPAMVDRGSGRVLFTSSVAATMPGPYYATYAASKAFLLSFAEALRHEVSDRGVTVTALLPGPTDTDFFDRAGMQDTPIYDADKDDPADVAREGFAALMAGKHRVVAGSVKNRVQTAAAAVLPEPAKAALHARMTDKTDDRKTDN